MSRHYTNTASFFTVLIAGLIFSCSLAGADAAQTNTSLGTQTLQNNTTGQYNTATGFVPLFSGNSQFQYPDCAVAQRSSVTCRALVLAPRPSVRYVHRRLW